MLSYLFRSNAWNITCKNIRKYTIALHLSIFLIINRPLPSMQGSPWEVPPGSFHLHTLERCVSITCAHGLWELGEINTCLSRLHTASSMALCLLCSALGQLAVSHRGLCCCVQTRRAYISICGYYTAFNALLFK